MALRIAQAMVLLIGLAGCVTTGYDLSAVCLEKHPGEIRCCEPGGHIDNGICCAAGYHGVADIEHADWKSCVADVDPCADAGACLDAGTDAQ